MLVQSNGRESKHPLVWTVCVNHHSRFGSLHVILAFMMFATHVLRKHLSRPVHLHSSHLSRKWPYQNVSRSWCPCLFSSWFHDGTFQQLPLSHISSRNRRVKNGSPLEFNEWRDRSPICRHQNACTTSFEAWIFYYNLLIHQKSSSTTSWLNFRKKIIIRTLGSL